MSAIPRSIKKIIESISGRNIVRTGSLFLSMKKDRDLSECSHDLFKVLSVIELKTMLEKYEINLVLDVGANQGQFAAFLRNNVNYDKQIISFEPISSVFEELKENASVDPEWDVYNLALGSRDTKKKIYLSDNSLFSSFLISNNYCEQRFGQEATGNKQETVTIRRLDGLFNEIKVDLSKARIYLKMDTQGYDLEVFSGLGDKNKYISILQSELSVTPIYKGMPHLTESISCFEKAGFELAGLSPVNRDQLTLRIIEYDCMMVNTRFSNQSG